MGSVSTTKPPAGAPVDKFLTRLPAFSPVAVRLLSQVADENVSFKEVAKLISMDPVLAGETLRVANSGLYGRGHEIQSVLHAIAIVGLHRLTRVVVTAALWRGIPNRTSPFMKSWWRHSLATAMIAEHTATMPVDHAYTAGLLHGIGQLALMEHGGADYAALASDSAVSGVDLQEREREVYGIDHAELAALILESWGLPEAVQDAAGLHHWPNPMSDLAEAVQIGCMVAEHVGFGACGCHRHLAAQAVSPEIAAMIQNQPLLDVFATEVNNIECSLV